MKSIKESRSLRIVSGVNLTGTVNPHYVLSMRSDLISSSVRLVLLPRALSNTFRSLLSLRSSIIRLWTDCVRHTRTLELSSNRLRSAAATDFIILRTRTKLGETAFSVSGPTTWNSLPQSLRTVDCIATFKHQPKTILTFICVHIFSFSPP